MAVPGFKALGNVGFYGPGTGDMWGALKDNHDEDEEFLGVVGVINHALKKRGGSGYKTFTKRAAGERKMSAWVTDKMIVVGLPE
jgi:hypothetical protein